MFFRRRPASIDVNVNVNLDADEIKTTLEKLMSNQELFDSYAAKIHDQNSQIKAAVAVILSEVIKLQKASESPLDTSKMDAAIEQLTAAVDEVEAIPAPPVEEQPAPVEAVEVEVEDLAVELDEEEDSEEE